MPNFVFIPALRFVNTQRTAAVSIILQYRKSLNQSPVVPTIDNIKVKTYSGEHDIQHWLELRRIAFENENVPAGPWNEADFRREFLAQSWWKPERLWLAESSTDDHSFNVVGTVALAESGSQRRAAIHWLAVHPNWRRQGIATMLLRQAELYCWQHDWRTIHLETHQQWLAATKFYETMGYVK